ncbi:hypothetical protein [Crocosphaera sp.]|uniref:hypothetical protein n=1 Tax=Crocosphaera sp. TaxID=2729996 RepID=UPI0026034D36|nr:hypothetical protein [Crocosphaera sp.]MDJ0579663.1 hypothetical protein [Crocosphaera sp.]
MVTQTQSVTEVYYEMGSDKVICDVNPQTYQPINYQSEKELKAKYPLAEKMPLEFVKFCIQEVLEIVFKQEPKLITEERWNLQLNVMLYEDYIYSDLDYIRTDIFKAKERLFGEYTNIFIKVKFEGDTHYYQMSDIHTLCHKDIVRRLISFLIYGNIKQNAFATNYLYSNRSNEVDLFYSPKLQIRTEEIIQAPCCVIANVLSDRSQYFVEEPSLPKE